MSALPFPPMLMGFRTDTQAPVELGADELVRHLAVFGTTGSGKTSMMLALMTQLMDRGRGFIFCTTKHDPVMPRALAWAAFRRQQLWRLRVFDPMHPVHTYNPISTTNPTRLAKLYHSQLPPVDPGSEAQHYHDLALEFLLVACRAVVSTGLGHTPEDIYHLAANWDTVRRPLARRLAAVQRQDLLADLDGFFRRFWRNNQFQVGEARAQLEGLMSALQAMNITHFRDILAHPVSAIDLLRDIRRACWIYMGLPRALDSDGGRFGRMFLTDLIGAIDEIQRSEGALAHAPFVIMLDEFPSYAVPEFATVFEQARSAGVALVMGAQTVSGLSDRSAGLSEGFRDRVLGNCAHLVSFRIGPGEGAEYLSRYAGRHDRAFAQVSETVASGRFWSPLSFWAWLGLSSESRTRARFSGYRVARDAVLESRVLTHELASRGEAVWLSTKDADRHPFRFRAVWAEAAEAPRHWNYRAACPQWSFEPPPMLELGAWVRMRQMAHGDGQAAGEPPAAPTPQTPPGTASRAPAPAAGTPRRRGRAGPGHITFLPPGR